MKLLEKTIHEIRPIDPRWIDSACKRQLELTKPPGSLGRLEEIANRCAAIHESFELTASRPRIVLFAADHGVCAEGVSAYPQEVTAQMVLNFLGGGAAINAFARAGGIALTEADMGAGLEAGIELAFDSAAAGCDLLGFGEMGIGNTTSASAITSALTG